MSLQAGWPSLEYSNSESQVLERVRDTIKSQRATKPVAAVLVEPVNWSTGESMSDSLIDQIALIAHENDARLIVDETNTGCGATGRGFWAYNGG